MLRAHPRAVGTNRSSDQPPVGLKKIQLPQHYSEGFNREDFVASYGSNALLLRPSASLTTPFSDGFITGGEVSYLLRL